MNNLLTYSHHLNTLMATINVLSKTVKDFDERMKKIELNGRVFEKQVGDLAVKVETLQDVTPPQPVAPAAESPDLKTLQAFIKDEVAAAIQALPRPPTTQEPVKLDALQSIVKAEVEAAIQALLQPPPTVEAVSSEAAAGSEAATGSEAADDILIQERKSQATPKESQATPKESQATKKPARKPAKRT